MEDWSLVKNESESTPEVRFDIKEDPVIGGNLLDLSTPKSLFSHPLFFCKRDFVPENELNKRVNELFA